MPPAIATAFYLLGIVALFLLDRDQRANLSKAVWIPVFWLLIAGSRPISAWLETDLSVNSPDKLNIEADPLNVIISSLLLTAGLLVLAGRRRQVGAFLQANWPILLFFCYTALSTLWSDYPGAAFRKWIRSTGDLVMVLVVLTDSDPRTALERLLSRAGFVLLPLSVMLIKYYPHLGRAFSNDFEQMYTGVTTHKNSLGVICVIFGLGFLSRFLHTYRAKGEQHRGRRMLVYGLFLSVVLWLLSMANSATSSACFAMASTLFIALSVTRVARRLAMVHLLVVLLLILPLFAVFADSGAGLVESLGRNTTLTGRSVIWQQVIEMADNQLLGTGFESFWLGERLKKMWSRNVGAQLNEAHNGYLEVYLNLGLCGVTLLIVLIVTGYRNVICALRRERHSGALRLAYFVAAVVGSFTEAGFRMISPSWIFFLLATTAVPKPLVREGLTFDRTVANFAPAFTKYKEAL